MKFKPYLQALKLWLMWNIATDLGLSLALVVAIFSFAFLAGPDAILYTEQPVLVAGFISGLAGGAVLGAGQWLIIGNKIKNAGRWILATIAGWIIISMVAFWMTAWDLESTNGFMIIAATIGAIIGFSQWLVLRQQSPNAFWWVVANIVGWTGAILAAGGIANTGLGGEGSIEISVGLIVIGMVTGVGFVFLFDKTSERSFNVKISAGTTLATILGVGLLTSLVFSQSKFTLRGHDNQIYAVAFSPDGNILASGSYDNTVKLWDVSTGDEIRTLGDEKTEYDKAVEYISFSPDGKLLAALLADSTIKLWVLDSGQELESLISNEGRFYSLMFSPDGRLALAGGDKMIIWDITTGRSESWMGRSGISIDISSDGRFIVSTFQNNVTILDIDAGKEIGFFEADCCSTTSVAFTPDGKFVVSGGSAGRDQRALILWDVNSGKRVRTFGDEAMLVTSIAISPDGKFLAVGLWNDPAIRLYDLATGQELAALRGHTDNVNSIAFSPNGKFLASGSYDDTVRLWDLTKIK